LAIISSIYERTFGDFYSSVDSLETSMFDVLY